MSKRKHTPPAPAPPGRYRCIAYYPAPGGLWHPIASPWFVGPTEPILLARGALERHHQTQQRAAAAVIDSAGAVVWQGYTKPGAEIRIESAIGRKRPHLSRSKALEQGGAAPR